MILAFKHKITLLLASLFMAITVVSSAAAIGEGQIEGGDIYRIRNETKGTDFSDPANAEECETVQYRVFLHNPGPGVVGSVNVSATLPGGASSSHTSTVTITGQNMQPASVSDTATLQLPKPLSISYISGSTELLDRDNNVLHTLPDGITTGGVTIGDVGVSLEEIRKVQFKAEIECPEKQPPEEQPPEEQPPEGQPPSEKPPAGEQPQGPAPGQPGAPSSLPAAGPTDILAIGSLVAFSASLAYRVAMRKLEQA